MHVENMVSSRGNYVPNQFIIKDDKGREIFQSYETTIVIFDHGKITLDDNALHYSATTSKYLYMFLGMSKKEILADKSIKYKNLNGGK